MYRPLIAALVLVAILPGTGCQQMLAGGSAPAQPGLASQSTMLALQTWLMIEQSKASSAATRLAGSNPAEAQKQTARAASAGNIMSSLAVLRTESNCGKRLQLATAVSSGLQSEFPTYQSELSLGTGLAATLASGFPGCQ